MSTTIQTKTEPVAEIEARPTISFTNVIETIGGTNSFSGWGPKVTGTSTPLTRWN